MTFVIEFVENGVLVSYSDVSVFTKRYVFQTADQAIKAVNEMIVEIQKPKEI